MSLRQSPKRTCNFKKVGEGPSDAPRGGQSTRQCRKVWSERVLTLHSEPQERPGREVIYNSSPKPSITRSQSPGSFLQSVSYNETMGAVDSGTASSGTCLVVATAAERGHTPEPSCCPLRCTSGGNVHQRHTLERSQQQKCSEQRH